MNKKKIASLLVIGALAVGVVGGTFAWFTASDSVTNPFSTGTTDDPSDPDAGIKVQEEYKPETGKNLTPGAEVNKDVQVKSTASYDQFIRVKLDKVWKNADGNVITNVTLEGVNYTLDASKIILNYRTANISTNGTEGTWVDGGDGYLYYIGKVGAASYTNTLLDSVTLSSTAKNEYKSLKFDVIVTAESIQASHGAYKDWAPASIQSYLGIYENKVATAPTNAAEPDGVN
ncbi:BsaA family SipW-dependent biofilm matrix protein [Clostridium paraputrificum]|uniref:BsaA family SipW-dependent biofilm matrix protein n=1 Tax=Clostridium TaxID=1485 RepID=UPI003D32CEB2